MALFPGSGSARVGGLAAAVLLAASLTGCGKDVRDAEVHLASVRNATVVSAGGTERPATDGATLGKGDRVRTGKDGTATLVVRERRVVLGGTTDVLVPDGATVELAKGAVLVDRRRGPSLTLRAGDTTLERIGTGALRVERSLSVRVSALSAGTRLRTVTGQRIDVGAYHQVGVSGRAVPRGVVPLTLLHDAWERQVIPSVLEDDDFLNDQAAALDEGATVVPATYRPQAGLSTSVALLTDAIGRAVADDPAAQAAAATRARDLREQGGSWGVVAALLRTNSFDVGKALTGVLTDAPGAASAPSSTGATSPDPGGPGTVAGGTPRPPVGGPTPGPSRTAGPGPRPTSSRPTQPTSSPTTASPSPSSVTDEVLKVIPTPLVPPVVASAGSLLGL